MNTLKKILWEKQNKTCWWTDIKHRMAMTLCQLPEPKNLLRIVDAGRDCDVGTN